MMHRSAMLTGAFLCAAALASPLAGAGAGARAPAESSAVWRTIFARPEAPPPPEPAKVALGYDLFRDVRLSGDETLACASCHHPNRAFTDGRKVGRGAAGTDLARNVPGLYDLEGASHLFWDGRASTLADQARGPILARDEMSGDFATIVARLVADPEMARRFKAVYPASETITEADLVDALAAYERSLASPPTRFDRWVAGDDTALSDAELRGLRLFVGKAACVSCHGGWRLTDNDFHDIGLPGSDLGRGALDGPRKGLPEFKTPSLREAAHTAPYMHDGSLATLADVVDHYAGGLVKRPSLAPTLVRDLSLTAEEKAALVQFLKSASSEPGDGGPPLRHVVPGREMNR